MTWENVMIRHVDDEQFKDAFYRMNDRLPPCVLEQPIDLDDGVNVAYSMNGGKWPEVGFIVESPKQPETLGVFSMMISKPNS